MRRLAIYAASLLTCGALTLFRAQQAEPVADLGTPEGLKGKVYFISPVGPLPDFDRLEPVGTIYTNPMFVKPTNTDGFPGIPTRRGWFAIDYTGKIYIRNPGTYVFQLVSDDGAKFYIDGKVVVDNDHGLGDWTGMKTLKLTGGMHRVRLSYFQGPLGHHCITLQLSVMPPGSKDWQPFDTRNFDPPTSPAEWTYGTPSDFDIPPDADVGRVRLKDVIATQGGATIRDLLSAVRLAIEQHTPDKSLAKSLGQFVLKEKLDSTTIEELQSEGAGPETVAMLERLLRVSSSLPVASGASPFNFPPHPTIEEQKSFFHKVNANAMQYVAGLPDFICTETVRRYTAHLPLRFDSTLGPPLKPEPQDWKAKDLLTVKLTYFGNHEKYELTQVNGHKTERGYESSGGALAEGDFGTQLLEIFSPDSETKFKWDHWTRLRKRLTQVYSFRTGREHSHYKLSAGVSVNSRQTTVAGRHGFVYADNETFMVMRITGQADDIQQGFPVRAVTSILDYDMADVGSRKFLLPLRAEHQMKSLQLQYKNVEEFHDYRKFVGESTISFGDPDPK